MRRRTLIGLGCLGLGMVAWLGFVMAKGKGHWGIENSSITAAATASSQAEQPDVTKVVEELQSEEEGTREKGKSALRALGYEDRDQLRRLGRGLSGVPREWVEGRLAEMDEHLVWEPLPVSLHVKEASLEEAIGQLQGQMRAHMRANPLDLVGRYTLDVEKKPFWEVVLAMNEKSPLALGNLGGIVAGDVVFIDLAGRKPWMLRTEVKGPFLFYVRWQPAMPARTFGSTVMPARGPVLVVRVAMDPRLVPVEFEGNCEPLVDELGHVLYAPPAPMRTSETIKSMRLHTADLMHDFELPLAMPADVGKKILSVKVSFRVVLGMNCIEGEIGDVERHLNEPVELGETVAGISKCESDRQLNIASTAESKSVRPYVVYDLYDKDNESVTRWTFEGNTTRGTAIQGGGPYRVHMTAPQRTKEFKVEFETKDLELP